MEKHDNIYIAGHKGMVGSAIWRNLNSKGYSNLIGFSSKELDLRNENQVQDFFSEHKPQIVINAAARVGGIVANMNSPYDFLIDNLRIQNNLIRSAVDYEVENFIFLGSSCIYPKLSSQPITEESLLTGPLEPTNEAYALAKIIGLKSCEGARKQLGRNFVSFLPTNLYGYNDNFDLEASHVLPAMIRKFHDAKLAAKSSVVLWGTGSPLREFLFVDDLAEAISSSLLHELPYSMYNVGSGVELSIRNLAEIISDIIGYKGAIVWDTSKPDGTPRKLIDSSRIRGIGWEPKVSLEEGILKTYKWFLNNPNFKGSEI